jgi:hypothetical protein
MRAKRWDSLPMWVHYAHRAQGFVIEYNNLEGIFQGDETGWLNQINDVSYSRETKGVSFYPNSYGAIFFSKLNDWAYEAESRIVSELERCTKVNRDGNNTYFRRVPVEHISRLIIGWRMPDSAIQPLLDLLRADPYRHIEIKAVNVYRGHPSLESV